MDKIAEWLGYTKITNDNILDKFVETLPNLEGDMTPEDEIDLMKRLDNVDGFKKWINFVVFRDMKNHYTAVNDRQRDMIRGGSQRMLDVLKRISNVNKPKVETTRISGVRYGH